MRLSFLAVLVVGLAVVPGADAYVIGGRPWPDDSITYNAGTGPGARDVDRAARVWNRARVGVRLRREPGSYADVVFRSGGPHCGGAAPIGYQRWWRVTVLLGHGCNRRLVTLNAVHELGHVLGLDHERRRCALMNPSSDQTGTPSRCRRRALRWWLRHPLRGDDVRGARTLYSGGAWHRAP